jgi:hypothetical protein
MLSWKHILCFSQKFKELKIENYAHILCLSSSPRQTVSVLIQTTFRPTFDFHTNSFFLIFFRLEWIPNSQSTPNGEEKKRLRAAMQIQGWSIKLFIENVQSVIIIFGSLF